MKNIFFKETLRGGVDTIAFHFKRRKKSKMKKLLQYTLLAIITFGFVGCGGDYSITYNTSPIGASIVCGGVGQGLSPLTLYYNREGIDDDGFLYTTPCKAVFSSGYVDYFGNKWDTNQFPQGVQQTLTRPQGDGYQQDMAFGMEHQRMLIMQRQADAAQMAAQAARDQANAVRWGINKPTTCIRTGNMVTCN